MWFGTGEILREIHISQSNFYGGVYGRNRN